MMRSLYSAVSGLQVHQTSMDNLSNNISNVNTTGYKKSQVKFQDMLSQMLQGATASTNAEQIGSGVQVGSIGNIMTQGSASTTGKDTDLMIQGEGFFIVTDGTNQYYTRAGDFSLDSTGYLVNSDGKQVCDSGGSAIQLSDYSGDISIVSDGTISYIDTSGASQTYGEKMGLATFTNSEGLTKYGNSLYAESDSSGTATLTTPGTNSGTLTIGSLEMSNVDLAQEFVNMIVAERGYQANSKAIQTADSMLETLIQIKR